MDQSQGKDRNYYRANAEIMVRYGPVNEKARHAMAMDQETWRFQAQLEAAARSGLEAAMSDDATKPLADMLRWLDYKLDLVLYHLTAEKMAEFFPHQALTVDISGSGLGLAEVPDLGQDQQILLSIALPDAPSRPIYAVGKVVRKHGQAEPGKPRAAVTFEDISDDDRERIIRYNFRQQRRELARRTEEEFS